MYRLMMAGIMLLLSACSGGNDTPEPEKQTGDHVWKSQTDMIDRARDVENTVLDQGLQQRRAIDEQAR
jgi:hypothetical protein